MEPFSSQSLWRQVSLHTPVIWTSVDVDMFLMYERSDRSTSTTISILSVFLQRSQAHPIHVQLDLHPELGAAQQLFNLLREESKRWASFKFSVPRYALASANASDIAKLTICPNPIFSFNILREIDLERLSEIPGWMELLKAFGQSPSLRKVALTDVQYVMEVFSDFPWSRLHGLKVFETWKINGSSVRLNYPETFVEDILSKSPPLEELETSQYMWRKSPALSFGPGRLLDGQCIVELTLRGWSPGPERLDHMDVSSLYLPSLQHLRLYNGARNEMNQIVEMLERSSCRLISVWLIDITLLEVTVKRLLSTSRGSLRKVVLLGRTIGPSLLECFFSSSYTDTSRSHFFLPHLEELDVSQMLMVDLGPYDRVLGHKFPSNLSCFHHELEIRVNPMKDSIALLTKPVPDHELAQRLLTEVNSRQVQTTIAAGWDATGTALEVRLAKLDRELG
ncbi:hypothetical protein PQX77_012334 [Marasmius sp. AFHP31]|nr:hypothetical protein PQX77_012334 [Marasmius sp. AFHP31]